MSKVAKKKMVIAKAEKKYEVKAELSNATLAKAKSALTLTIDGST